MPVGGPGGSWAIELNEEFSANGLNTSLWTPEFPTDVSGQCTSSNLVSQPGDGFLHLALKAEAKTCSGPKGTYNRSVSGGLVTSEPKPGHKGFEYTYGYVEWRAYLPGIAQAPSGYTCPTGGCIENWPAFWSIPENGPTEIDVMEGLEKGKACYSFHKWYPEPHVQRQGCLSNIGGGWHTFGAYWEQTGPIKYYYDGNLVGEQNWTDITSNELMARQRLIASYLEPRTGGGPFILPAEALVDYVRVWKRYIPPKPATTTNAATEIGQTTTKLSGWVNPNGSPTNYYFQYGKTTSYGNTIPAPPGGYLGNGTSSLYAWNIVSGLEPGTTYHYRIVATNSSGTSYGTDQAFTTAVPVWGKEGQTPGSAVYRENIDGLFMFYPQTNGVLGLEHMDSNLPGQWVFDQFPETAVVGRTSSITRANGDVMSFYRGTDSRIHVTWLDHLTNAWHTTGAMTGLAAGPPSAVERNNGDVHVLYKGTDGVLHDLWLSGTTWHDQWMGGSPAGNPAVLNRTSNGDLHVFYRDTSGPLYDLWLSGTEWHNQYLGGAPVTDPKPLYRAGSGPGAGDVHVFYKATDGALYDLWLSGTGWYNTLLGGAPAGNAAPLYRTKNGDLHAFYRGTSGYLYDWWMDAQTNVWHESLIAGPLAGTASPINRTKNGDVHVFYVRPNGDLYDASLSGTGWKDEFIRSGAAVPTATE